MDKICKKCAADPTSHSYKKVTEKNGVSIYYSHPATAKLYDDMDGIIEHVDRIMSTNGSKKWICIFNGEGFGVKHTMEFTMGVKLAELLTNKYGDTLQEMKIINPTWYITYALKIVHATVKPSIVEKIKVLDDRRYSVLEFI